MAGFEGTVNCPSISCCGSIVSLQEQSYGVGASCYISLAFKCIVVDFCGPH